jgi:hypothetical protein
MIRRKKEEIIQIKGQAPDLKDGDEDHPILFGSARKNGSQPQIIRAQFKMKLVVGLN